MSLERLRNPIWRISWMWVWVKVEVLLVVVLVWGSYSAAWNSRVRKWEQEAVPGGTSL